MGSPISIRLAGTDEQHVLEALQLRASLNNPGDRDAILAHPDAIILPLEQLNSGQVFIAEQNGMVAGFAVVLPREDGQIELDGLFVEPSLWKVGIGRALVDHCVAYARNFGAQALHVTGNPHRDSLARIHRRPDYAGMWAVRFVRRDLGIDAPDLGYTETLSASLFS